MDIWREVTDEMVDRVIRHCACAESRDPWVGGQKQLHYWNPRPRFVYSLCNFGGYTMKVIKVICENNAQPRVQKTHMSFCACAKSRDLLKMPEMTYCSRSRRRRFTYWTSKVEHIVSFTAIFSNMCTAHAQKRLFIKFRQLVLGYDDD